MTITCTEKIPLSHFEHWHGILCETGGRYRKIPICLGDCVYVDYAPGDYVRQCELYAKITTPIIEVRKDQKWRVILRRLGLKF